MTDFDYMIGNVYQHYKGKFVEVLGIGTNTEDGEYCVIYHEVDFDGKDIINWSKEDDKTWIRPISIWSKEVNVDGKYIPRFKLVYSHKETMTQLEFNFK